MLHQRFALGLQPRQHQRSPAPKVAGRYIRAAEPLYTAHHRRPARAQDPRAHPVQITGMCKPVLKYILHNYASSF